MRIYVKEELEAVVRDSTSIRQVLLKLGIIPAGGNYSTIKRKIKQFNLDTSHFTGQACNKGKTFGAKIPTEEYLVYGSTIKSYRLKARLIAEGLFRHECFWCGLTEWRGRKIPIELDHINGDSSDNTIQNLRLLCPNCHAQTKTYRRKKSRRSDSN